MLDYDWENSVGYWICSVSHAMRKALDARLSKEGITVRQWEVLSWLSARGCGSQSELAEQLGIEPHTLAGVLTRMEKAGLLVRKSCELDRRKNQIHPTPKAEELWKRVVVIFHENREKAIDGLSREDLDNLKRICELIYNNITDPSSPDLSFSPCQIEQQFLREQVPEKLPLPQQEG